MGVVVHSLGRDGRGAVGVGDPVPTQGEEEDRPAQAEENVLGKADEEGEADPESGIV